MVTALLLIIAGGTFLRVYKLGAESIWLDEAFTIQITRGSISSIVNETAKDVHPPLYYIVFHFWLLLFGDSEFSARLLSALFGVLSILAIYALARLLFDKATGLFAALLLALSQFHVEFAQEARMYTLLTLLTLLSMYFLVKLISGKSRLVLAGYVVSSALMMYTHVYSLFILAAQNLFFLSLLILSRETFKRTWKRWLLAQVVLGVLFLPWVSVLMQQVSRVEEGFWIPRLPASAILDTLRIYAGSTALTWVFFPLVALALIVGWKVGGKGSETASSRESSEIALDNRSKISLLSLWLVCPILLPFILSQISVPIFLPKYTIPASLAFTILVAYGLRSVRIHQLQMVLILLILGFSMVFLRIFYKTLRKDAWRDAVANVNKLARTKDLILFNQQSGYSPFDYYLRRNDLIEKPFPDYSSVLTVDNVAELLKPEVEGRERVWLVLSHQGILSPLIAEQLKQWYTVADHRVDPGVETYLFEKKR